MCGIIGVVSRPSGRPVPDVDAVLDALAAAEAASGDLLAVVEILRGVDRQLRGVPGVMAIAGHPEAVPAILARLDAIETVAESVERELDEDAEGSLEARSERAERIGATLIEVRDAVWAIRRDRLGTIGAVIELAGRGAGAAALDGYLSVQQALAGLDRLEVRGRDSAGLHVFVWDHDLDLGDPAVTALVDARRRDPLFRSGSVRAVDGCLSFVYKAAAEIGELGDNTRSLRSAIVADALLRRALGAPAARASVLGHTRWASVGIISEPNTHPLNSEELEAGAVDPGPYVVAVLNGDVDNHADLRAEHGLRIHGQITTDAKVIPALVARHASSTGTGREVELVEAFRRTVSAFDGSVAVGAASAAAPGTLLLALRGSGQGLYVGVAEDRYVVASEPYGVVEEADRYLRLDGEHGGEIVAIDARHAGDVSAIHRAGYDGQPRPVQDADLVVAEVTTRDIDRGDAPHFLLKEILESPESFRKTLRSKIVERDGRLRVSLGPSSLPPAIVDRLRSGAISRVRVIGQGTAAVAGQSTAAILDELADGALEVRAVTATELSGFQMRLDMADTLAIAVSQSGTTTDTNRTVDLLRSRGASVIAIVNRRASDLVDKADGVVYTSDGRDVEMSVASTKAFYAQVAAGALLACAVTDAAALGSDDRRHALAQALREMPDALREVIAQRPLIAEVAQRYAPAKRYWAVVGNGPNRVAAEEVRIKLSELCYKSIACDATEDKKHIDLSSEPLILVCAAGLQGGTVDDVAKETAIFRAHKATPIVVADQGESRYAAVATIPVPAVDPALGFVLSAMAGHLFGYEAALAIDASARPLREIREVIERAASDDVSAAAVLEAVRHDIGGQVDQYVRTLADGGYDGQLEASTAVRLANLLRDLIDDDPVEEYQRRSGKVGTPAALLDEVVLALTRAIEELTRPIDAIKHQAKTVTVGISRSDEGIMDRALVQAVLAAGAGRDRLTYRTLKVLADLDPAVAEVTGSTRYAIDGDHVSIVDRAGIARDIPSRVDRDGRLVGTKRRVADERDVLVAQGRSDGRTVIFVPETKADACVGITLVHVRFHDRLEPAVMRGVLQGYDRRYDRLVDWVTETEGRFDENLLGSLPVVDLLIKPISETADLWRR